MSDIVKDVEKELQQVLQENKLKISYQIEFPRYKILPDSVKLALSVLEYHGMKIVFTLVPDIKK